MELETANESTADVTQTGTSQEPVTEQNPTVTTEAATEYKPFQNGKEKFKVDDKEEEWDWNTAKKYAQLGKSSMSRFEQAAKIQKQARETYQKMLQAAQKDPEGLIRMFNPQFQGFNAAKPGSQATEQNAGVDPKDQKLSEYESKLQKLEEKFEATEVAEERKAMESELDASIKDYPQLNNKIHRSYIKQQYLAALKAGLYDLTIQDFAFQTAQEVDGLRAQEREAKQKRIEENKRKAPIGTVPGKAGEKPMSREDVLKLAGRIP